MLVPLYMCFNISVHMYMFEKVKNNYMHMSAYVYECVCVHVYVCVCVYVYVYVCMCVCMYVCPCMHMCMYVAICAWVCMCAQMFVYQHIDIYAVYILRIYEEKI